MIQEIIEKEIRPVLQADGGDVKLIDVDGNDVIVSLMGMCRECLMADITTNNIQKKLNELVHKDIKVVTE
jgi:NifU-like protein